MTLELFRLALLVATMLPLLVANLREGTVPNPLNALLLAVGLVVALFGSHVGLAAFDVSSLFWWLPGAALLLWMALRGWAAPGVAKFLIALFPWYDLQTYLLLMTCGMGLTALCGFVFKRQEVLIVPPMLFAVVAIGVGGIVLG
jgi:Flp pilus assembly protein protease CpaA